MKELRIFAQNRQQDPKSFMLLPIFLRLSADALCKPSQVAELYQTPTYKALLEGIEPEPDWAQLAASIPQDVGVRPEQVHAITAPCNGCQCSCSLHAYGLPLLASELLTRFRALPAHFPL